MSLKITDSNGTEGVMEDMGLMYVTKFSIDDLVIYSPAPKDVTAEERLRLDAEVLASYGYSGIEWKP